MLGAHNVLSAYEPLTIKDWLLNPFAKCQDKSIKELYEFGVRCFDIRIKFGKNQRPIFCHGMVNYSITPEEVLELVVELNQLSTDEDPIYFRVMLEFNSRPDDWEMQEACFKCYAMMLQELGSKCHFFNFRTKYDGTVIKSSSDKELPTIDPYSSVNWTGISQTFTKLYAFIYNSFTRKFLNDKINSKDVIVLMDFI